MGNHKTCRKGHSSDKDSLGRCKVCRSIVMKNYYARNKTELARRNLQWRTENPEKKYASDMAVVSRRYSYPEPTRDSPKLCECCGKADLPRRLSLDHCHKTGVFRGWLCKECNMGLGKLGDDIPSVEQALSYLKRAYGEANV